MGSSRLSDIVRGKLAPLFHDSEWGASLPTSTSNSAADLVPRDAFRDAYRTALKNPDVAEGLMERITARPDERQRAISLSMRKVVRSLA